MYRKRLIAPRLISKVDYSIINGGNDRKISMNSNKTGGMVNLADKPNINNKPEVCLS